MKSNTLFFTVIALCVPVLANAATCSRANLTRCLDSVCAINASSNPAARCQYCGNSAAGTPPTSKMRSVSVGASAKYTLSEKELKSAPSDAGARYVWATNQCIKKVANCTPDDVSETYDELISQSCRAAGISAQFASLRENISDTKTISTCRTDITACVTDDKRCGADYRGCGNDADFDAFFAACGVDATGCDEHLTTLRTELSSARANMEKNADALLANIVASYQADRARKITTAQSMCKNNTGRDECVKTICANNMTHQCDDAYPSERDAALQLCKFYDSACGVLK